MANLKLSAVFTYRREKNTRCRANPDNPYATTPSVGVDPGLDGVVGHGRRWDVTGSTSGCRRRTAR